MASLASRTATGGRAAISMAIRLASSRYRSTGTTRLTRPNRSASTALIGSPMRMASMARTFPADRVQRWVPPAPGMMPSLTSGCPNWAVSEATIRSHISASSHPPPKAYPLTAAISGLVSAWMRAQRLKLSSFSTSMAPAPAISVTSAPAANARSLPVRMRQRIAGSRSKASSAWTISAMVLWFSALRTWGRLMVTIPTGPSAWVRMNSNDTGDPSFAAEPESTESNLHLGRGCGRSGRRVLRALGYAPTGARPRVLVASCGSARPASRSASSDRRTRATLGPVQADRAADAAIAALSAKIRDVPNFPKEGILFKDITTLLMDPAAFREAVDLMAATYRGKTVDLVVGVESRGFIFGGALAYQLGAGFVPVRKQGKLPAQKITESYALEDGSAVLEIHKAALKPGQPVD